MKINNYKVIKRSGEVVPFEVNKIRNVIEWAVKGLGLNPIQLESNLEMIFKAKMSSIDIHNTIIDTALKLTSIEEPEWRIVASRLKVLSLYKDASQSRDYASFGYDSYYRFVNQAVKLGLYDDVIVKKYTSEELKSASKFLNPDFDLDFDYAGMNLMSKRYLVQHDNKVFELPQEAFLSIALLIEQDQDKEIRLKRVEDTYLKLASRKISLATPILINLRRPNGNLSSCFITAMDDSLKSISYVEEQVGFISQAGGGVGVNLSRVRSKGSYIQDVKGASGGVIPWIKIINDKAVGVNQLGKRAGAVTVSLDIWHRDVEDFLELQTETGDERRKARDIFPQVVIPDEFMRRVENDDFWFLFDPNDIKKKFGIDLVQIWGNEFDKKYFKLIDLIETTLDENKISHKRSHGTEFSEKWESILDDQNKKKLPEFVSKVKAKELLKLIMKTQVETGMPFISYKDTINKANPNKDVGTILAGNLCMESFSNTSPSEVLGSVYDEEEKIIKRKINPGDLHTCNLASINMSITEDDEIESVSSTTVRILDNLIELTTVPVFEGQLHNKKYRTIGVGFMGYADYVVKKGKSYAMSKELASDIFERYAMACTKASILLAKERGSFDLYEQSEYAKGIILSNKRSWYKKNSKYSNQWMEVFDLLEKYGIRNSQLTAIAPNSSTSLVQGCTPSILPIFGKFYMDSSSTTVPIMPPFIKENLWLYTENKNIDQRKVISIVAEIQKWIDTGISMELILNPNLDFVNARYFYELILNSWKEGCKTIYYVRSIQKNGDLDKGEEACASCAG